MTTIKLHNSMSRQKEVFAPIDPNNVRMYLCGPTVYDRAHIGNARNVIMFDVLFRLLRQVYGTDHVTYVVISPMWTTKSTHALHPVDGTFRDHSRNNAVVFG